MRPNTIFDKSAFQAMTASEHTRCFMAVNENVTAILLKEIVGDLSKSASNPEALVAALAGKFMGGGGAVNADWKLACHGSLTGSEAPMTAQILIDEFSEVTEPDGSSAILMEPTAGNTAIMRWARRYFLPDEKLFAEKFRREAEAFEVAALRGRLTALNLPAAKSIERIPQVVGEILDDRNCYLTLLDWLCDQLRPIVWARTRVAGGVGAGTVSLAKIAVLISEVTRTERTFHT